MNSILYCEDEPQYGEVIKRLHSTVEKRFHGEVKFSVVGTWEDLVFQVSTHPPSVILLDLGLSETVGPEDTLHLLKERVEGWPPVMVLTGNKFQLDLRSKAFAAGAEDFLIKDEANRNPEMLCERLYHCYLRRLHEEGA